MMGNLRAAPDIGLASNSQIPGALVNSDPAQILNPGVLSGGSVNGVHLRQGGLFWVIAGFPPPLPWGNASGVTLFSYDWTAGQTLGVVKFDWVADAGLPLPRMVLTNGALMLVPTTYFGISLTVVPGVGSAWVVGGGLALVGRRWGR